LGLAGGIGLGFVKANDDPAIRGQGVKRDVEALAVAVRPDAADVDPAGLVLAVPVLEGLDGKGAVRGFLVVGDGVFLPVLKGCAIAADARLNAGASGRRGSPLPSLRGDNRKAVCPHSCGNGLCDCGGFRDFRDGV
jgi:hypothetical protein